MCCSRSGLRCVRLFTLGLAPLLAECPTELRRVALPGSPGLEAALHRFPDLEELHFEGLHRKAEPEVRIKLSAWNGTRTYDPGLSAVFACSW